MEIQVEITKKDFIELSQLYLVKSKSIRRLFNILRVLLFITAFLFFILAMYEILENEKTFPILLFGFVTIGILGFYLIPIVKLFNKHLISSVINEGSMKTHIGPNTYRFKKKYFERRNDTRLERINWEVFEVAINTKTHIFLYDSPMNAYIIPKRSLSEDDINSIIGIILPILQKEK